MHAAACSKQRQPCKTTQTPRAPLSCAITCAITHARATAASRNRSDLLDALLAREDRRRLLLRLALGLLRLLVGPLERVAAADLLKQLREALGAARGDLLDVALSASWGVCCWWRCCGGGGGGMGVAGMHVSACSAAQQYHSMQHANNHIAAPAPSQRHHHHPATKAPLNQTLDRPTDHTDRPPLAAPGTRGSCAP